MTNNRNAGNGPLVLASLAIAAILLVIYFSYSFLPESPYVELNPQNNANFTILFYFLEKVFYLAVAGFIAFAALWLGHLILTLLRLAALPLVELTVASFGVGLGALSLITLGLGVTGALAYRSAPVAVLILFILLGTAGIREWLSRVQETSWGQWSFAEKALAAVGAAAAAFTLVYAFNPPMDFDVLEYHLGAPAYWFGHGGIDYIRYNVYSNFPCNAEMLYLFSMALTGSKLAGAIVGKVLDAFTMFAAAGAVFALGRWLHGRGAGIFAATAVLAAGGFFQVATAGYVEPLQVLYTVMAVLATGRFLQTGGTGILALAGIATGLAMGVKYPAAPFVAVPLALATLIRGGGALARIKHFVLFSVIALAVFSPWLVKNLVLTGNPLYPLLYNVFGGRDWSALQDARWSMAHTPKGGLAWEQWARHVFGTFFSNEMVSSLAFIFAPLVFFTRAATRRVLFVLGFALLYVFLWFALTHRIDRFLLPGLAVLAAVSGAGLFSLPLGAVRKVLSGLAVVLAVLNVFYIAAVYGYASGIDLSVPLYGNYAKFLTAKVAGYEAWTYMNENVPPREKVMLVGASETFYLDFDYEGTTVFDRKPLEEMVKDASGDMLAFEKSVKDSGVRWIFVDWATLRRQQETYAFQFDGREHGGYSDVISPAFFDGLTKAGIIRPVYSSGPEVYPGVRAYVLYAVD